MKNIKRYCILTYGCQMNVHESEKLAGYLEERGYLETNDTKDADVIVFNTCCIRKSAEEKILGNIGAIKHLKKKNPNLIVAVCGCMSQQDNMANLLYKRFPFLSIIFGTHNLGKFGKFLDDFENTKNRIVAIENEMNNIIENVPMVRSSGYNGWVNIMYGCNNFCTYCIVPYVRGREKSREMNDIILEVELLLKTGKYKVITLLGQNVNSYGKDLGDGVTFAKLLQKIAELPYNFKLKFMTSHPKDLTDDVIETIAKNDKISKTIHLPIQSGSNEILRRMNRNYTVEHYEKIIKKIRELIPNVSLTSDIIVGFPGETEKEFNETFELVKRIKYNGLFVFMYSPRPGTPASEMPNQVTDEDKHIRVNTLLALEKEISREISQKMIGSIENCIVDSQLNENNYVVKTDSGKTIIINDAKLNLNDFVDVKIISIENNQLYGQILEE